MKQLETLRNRIDNIDNNILTLLAQRFEVSTQIGVLKQKKQLKLTDKKREAEIFKRLLAMSKNTSLNPMLVKKIFRSIIDEVIKNHKNIT